MITPGRKRPLHQHGHGGPDWEDTSPKYAGSLVIQPEDESSITPENLLGLANANNISQCHSANNTPESELAHLRQEQTKKPFVVSPNLASSIALAPCRSTYRPPLRPLSPASPHIQSPSPQNLPTSEAQELLEKLIKSRCRLSNPEQISVHSVSSRTASGVNDEKGSLPRPNPIDEELKMIAKQTGEMKMLQAITKEKEETILMLKAAADENNAVRLSLEQENLSLREELQLLR